VLIALALIAPFLLFVAAARLARVSSHRLAWVPAGALARSLAPVTAGFGSAALTLFVWGSLDEPPVVHDEQAYVLQAEIFGTGRWTGEKPPVPEFFEQTHVFVEPRLAAKYPPGHALLLLPGAMLGIPGLMPVVLAGVAGALIFALTRRIGGGVAVALLTWALWSTSTSSLAWRSSYFSQSSSLVAWLVSLWACSRWAAERKTYHLAIVAGALGWMYLTRPLTALALAAPLGILVLVMAFRRRQLWQVGIACLIAVPLVLLNFLWQAETLGDWSRSPYAEYSQMYFPFVKPGFGVDPTPPSRVVPPEIAWVGEAFKPLHAAHRPQALPRILLSRIVTVSASLGNHWRAFLVLFFAMGVAMGPSVVRFAAVSGLALFLGYLAYAHPASWTLYYVEAFPIFFFVASYQLVQFAKTALLLEGRPLTVAAALFLLLVSPWLANDVKAARSERDRTSVFHRTARRVLADVPSRSVVFVQYPAGHSHHRSLIANTPDYRAAPVWVVYDRGERNTYLLRTTDRAAYRLRTADWSLERLR
jgi:hypothetical protein